MKRTKDLGAETTQWPSKRYLTIGSDFAGEMWVLQGLDQTFIAKEQS